MSNGAEAHPAIADPYLRRALRAIEAATAGLSAVAWDCSPAGRWNRAGIVEHLGRAYGSTAHILQKCLTDGAPKGRPPSWAQLVIRVMVVEAGYLPSGVQAPEMTVPEGMAGPEALAYARQALRALDAATTACEARFGPHVLLANHPLLGGFTVRHWRRFHWVHTRHHVRQIRRLRH